MQLDKGQLLLQISIHAPAKGATPLIKIFSVILVISIHAPAKGATKQRQGLKYILEFQSTLPRRERQKICCCSGSSPQTFQSTLPRRERRTKCEKWRTIWIFQSTLPRRERQQICTIFYYDIGISAQYYYIFLNKNNLMNSFKTNFNRFYYIFLVRISLHLHVKLLFAPHNTTLLTIELMVGQPRALC